MSIEQVVQEFTDLKQTTDELVQVLLEASQVLHAGADRLDDLILRMTPSLTSEQKQEATERAREFVQAQKESDV